MPGSDAPASVGHPPGQPGAPASIGMPAPGMYPAQPGPANYRRLPINYQGAAVRLEELRNLMPNIKPKEFQDMINDYLDWVGDLADGHWRIHQSFAKVDSMKDRAEVEKQTTLKFGQLKRQAMLLKAEFLIKENRHPEALQPLVEIVVAEPKTQTGDAAYTLLKQIGFSDEAPSMPVSVAPPKPVDTPAAAPTAAPPVAPPKQATKVPGKTAAR
jgi:hypothetical protein